MRCRWNKKISFFSSTFLMVFHLPSRLMEGMDLKKTWEKNMLMGFKSLRRFNFLKPLFLVGYPIPLSTIRLCVSSDSGSGQSWSVPSTLPLTRSVIKYD